MFDKCILDEHKKLHLKTLKKLTITSFWTVYAFKIVFLFVLNKPIVFKSHPVLDINVPMK